MKTAWSLNLAGFCLLLGCGSARPQVDSEPQTLATTEEDTAGHTPTNIESLIQRDENRAAEIIRAAACNGETTLSAWGAVYAKRLGIQHDGKCAEEALEMGIKDADPLLAALSWRWISIRKSPRAIPAWKKKDSTTDPIARAFATVALARHELLPPSLRTSLGLPNFQPRGSDRAAEVRGRVERLLALIAPYDDGPLALAIALVEVQRDESVETAEDGKKRWIAQRLRREFVTLLTDESDEDSVLRMVEKSQAQKEKSPVSLIVNRIDTQLVTRPMNVLYSIAVSADSSLRISALQVIAIKARQPVAGDFGAAAAGLDAADPFVRLEAARTFLLLTTRARL
jgi:hypothetical protein